jgi:hypothetical protein
MTSKIKPGIKTTEFWLVLLLPVVAVVITELTGIEISESTLNTILGMTGVSGSVYIYGRAQTKQQPAKE